MASFLRKLHRTPRIVAVKKKIRANKAAAKKLSAEYKRLIKSESKRLATKKKKTTKKKTRKR